MTERTTLVLLYTLSLACLFGTLAGSDTAFAQGATGGSLGNDSKTLSGSSSERSATPARRERSERRAPPERKSRREAAPRRGGGESGGGGSSKFDGVWALRSIGESQACPGTVATGTMTISGGSISGQGVTSGSVSANGAIRATASGDGYTLMSVGRLSGSSGGGSFTTSTGCTGRWSTSRQ